MPPGTQPSLNCRHPARQYTSSLPLHSLASGPWIWWQGLPLSQAAGTLAPSAITSRTSRKTDGAMEAWDGGGGGRPSPTPTWLAWLWQGVTMVVPTALACVLCCLVLVCPPLLWTRQRALPFALLESYRSKPSRFSEVRASRCPAGRLAPGGRTVGGVRRASLLLLVPWLAVCTAAGTICSNEPTACDGTYSGTYLCALPPHPVSPAELLTRRKGNSRVRRAFTRPPPAPCPPPLPRRSAPLPSHPSHPPAGAPLARRELAARSLSGSVPTQLGGLTALTLM